MKNKITNKIATTLHRTAKFTAQLGAIALCFAAAATPALAADIQINVNGSTLATDTAPTVLNNRVMLPLRACAEALNATVNYDAATGKIAIFAGSDKVELTLGTTTATINGETKVMDIEPQVIASRTLVPLRFIGEALNAQVSWIAATNEVNITAAKANSSQSTTKDNQTDDQKEVYMPSLDTIANQALQQINTVRLQKDLSSLVSAAELSNMAAAHSQNMSKTDTLSNKPDGSQSLSARAQALGIATPNELIACIDYSKENVYQAINAWLTDSTTRNLLLDASSGYIGISAACAEGSTKVYLTAEVMPYRAYFIGLPLSSTVSNPKLQVRGRSSRLAQEIIVYKISDQNPQMYTDKQTYTATGDGSYFTTEIILDTTGTYAIEAAGCTVRVKYRS